MWRGKEFLNSQLFVEPFDLSVVKLSVIIGGQGPGDAKLEADVILDKFEVFVLFVMAIPTFLIFLMTLKCIQALTELQVLV